MQLNKERIADTFAKFVAVDSPSYRERQMADYLKGLYAGLDIRLSEDDCAPLFGGNAGNLFGTHFNRLHCSYNPCRPTIRIYV